jgi:hypothetical protein
VLAVTRRLAVVPCLGPQSTTLEKRGHTRLQHPAADEPLQTVAGIGTMLAQTMALATGDMRRLPTGGHEAS